MAQATLIPNVKLKDEYGAIFPNAMLLILKADLSEGWGIKAEAEGDEYKETNQVGGGTYTAWYYCTPQAKAQGAPIKPLRTFEDGEFSSIIMVNGDQPEIKQLFSSSAANKDKVVSIIKKDLEIKAR